jgi:hypothetical protein
MIRAGASLTTTAPTSYNVSLPLDSNDFPVTTNLLKRSDET